MNTDTTELGLQTEDAELMLIWQNYWFDKLVNQEQENNTSDKES